MPDSFPPDPAGSSAAKAPLAGPRVEKVARLVAALAAACLALAGAWEIAGPMCAGHFAVTAARGIVADNMLSWGIIAPVRDYTLAAPQPDQVYAHHPWGMFWVITAVVKLLGRHAYAVRLVPVIMTSANALLLYGIGRGLYGAAAGALCAVAYAAVPLVLAYSSFPGFELPTLFGCLLATWGYVRMVQSRQRRWLAVSVLGLLWACQADWIGFVFAGIVLVSVFAGHVLAPSGWCGLIDKRRFARWFGSGVLVCAATLGFYLVYFMHLGVLNDLLESADARAARHRSLAELLEARSYWIDLMFTPLAVTVGKIAAPLFLIRLFLFRNLLEVFPLAVLLTALAHYLLFPNGVYVHIYWPMPFAVCFALGLGALARSMADAVGWMLARWGRRRAVEPAMGALLLAPALVPMLMIPDAARALTYGRMTGGRFNDDGHLNLQDRDKAAALAWMATRMEQQTRVRLHKSMRPDWSQEWTLHRPTHSTLMFPEPGDDTGERYFVADSRFLSARGQLATMIDGAVFAVGPFWLVDAVQPRALLQGFSFAEREPNRLERCLFQGNDPIRAVRADPYWTWELRAHFGQLPNPKPAAPPVGREQLRIAHNIAVTEGQTELAEKLRTQLLAPTDRRVATTYSDGTELVGASYVTGVAPKLVVYFLARGPAPKHMEFEIRSVVLAPERWSLVPADPVIKDVGLNLPLSPTFWMPGLIYASTSEIRKRPGRERFYGHWVCRDGGAPPKPLNRGRRTTLLVLP